MRGQLLVRREIARDTPAPEKIAPVSTDPEFRLGQLERKFDWPLLIAALLVIPAVAIDVAGLGRPWSDIGLILNWTSWLIFLVEAVVMLRSVGWLWVKKNPLPLIVTFITVPILPGNLDAARFLRFTRLLRVIPGAAAARRLFTIEGVKNAGVIVLATIVLGGVLFSHLESDSERSLTPLDGIWWAITTITTVGYGDYSPRTPEGKVLAGLVMLIGISFVALVTAFIAERFLAHDAEVEEDREKIESELDLIRTEISELNRKIDLLIKGSNSQ